MVRVCVCVFDCMNFEQYMYYTLVHLKVLINNLVGVYKTLNKLQITTWGLYVCVGFI